MHQKKFAGFTLISRACKGFTLIELLIVIAILGVLTTLFITTFPAAQRRARDARRQSDIKQYQTALEKYANRNNGSYLVTTGTINPSAQCAALTGGSGCPNDPVNTGSYIYRLNGVATSYVLWVQLEAQNPAQYFIACSNGKVGTSATAPSSSVCPL